MVLAGPMGSKCLCSLSKLQRHKVKHCPLTHVPLLPVKENLQLGQGTVLFPSISKLARSTAKNATSVVYGLVVASAGHAGGQLQEMQQAWTVDLCLTLQVLHYSPL